MITDHPASYRVHILYFDCTIVLLFSSFMAMSGDLEYWIYHERQEAMLCGQHALNNLVQACVFSPESLAELAVRVVVIESELACRFSHGWVTFLSTHRSDLIK